MGQNSAGRRAYICQREATTGRSFYRSNSGILRASEMHCRPLWVISGHWRRIQGCPLYPQKRMLIVGINVRFVPQADIG